MSENHDRKSDNVVKNASGEANNLVHKTVDASGNVVKTFAGKDGLVEKTFDASGNVIKSVSDKSNDFVGHAVDTSSKWVKGAASKFTGRNKR